MSEECSEFQARLLAQLAKRPNSIESTAVLAVLLGTSRLAVVSAARSLERKGRLVSFRSDGSQWASLMWSIRR
jgi:biotin operon repressor